MLSQYGFILHFPEHSFIYLLAIHIFSPMKWNACPCLLTIFLELVGLFPSIWFLGVLSIFYTNYLVIIRKAFIFMLDAHLCTLGTAFFLNFKLNLWIFSLEIVLFDILNPCLSQSCTDIFVLNVLNFIFLIE